MPSSRVSIFAPFEAINYCQPLSFGRTGAGGSSAVLDVPRYAKWALAAIENKRDDQVLFVIEVTHQLFD